MTMPKLLSATYHPNIEVAEFICEDGRHLLRSGGTLPWRINNPGDLTARVVDGVPAPKKAKGYVGFATTRSGRTFLIFPDEDAGRAELKANLKRKHGARTIPEAIPHYAPERQNDTAKYIDDLLRTSGIPASRRISDCTDAEIERIVDSISTIEGFHARAETRKETWVAVSRINATDGSQPVPDAEIGCHRAVSSGDSSGGQIDRTRQGDEPQNQGAGAGRSYRRRDGQGLQPAGEIQEMEGGGWFGETQ